MLSAELNTAVVVRIEPEVLNGSHAPGLDVGVMGRLVVDRGNSGSLHPEGPNILWGDAEVSNGFHGVPGKTVTSVYISWAAWLFPRCRLSISRRAQTCVVEEEQAGWVADKSREAVVVVVLVCGMTNCSCHGVGYA